MEKVKKTTLSKILKITGITFLITLLTLLLLPVIFADTVTEKVRVLANNNLEGELNFNDSELSFFKHFPSLTLTLHDLNLNGSKPFKEKPLISAKEVGFGINVWSIIFQKQTDIEEIYIDNAKINILVNLKGEANYNIYKSSSHEENSKDTTDTALKLERIEILNSKIIYDDQSTKVHFDALGFNYLGKGDLNKAVFDLYSKAKIEKLNIPYIY